MCSGRESEGGFEAGAVVTELRREARDLWWCCGASVGDGGSFLCCCCAVVREDGAAESWWSDFDVKSRCGEDGGAMVVRVRCGNGVDSGEKCCCGGCGEGSRCCCRCRGEKMEVWWFCSGGALQQIGGAVVAGEVRRCGGGCHGRGRREEN